MPVEKSELETNSSSTNPASRLFEDAYSNLNSGIKFVQARPAESITAGLVLGSAAAAVFALRGKGLAAIGSAGEEALGKNVLGNFLRGKSAAGERLLGGVTKQLDSAALKLGAEPVQYRSVAQEVAAFSRDLDAGLREHDALGHVLTLRNPATPGGELRAAISESVAGQMIQRPGKDPSFLAALFHYARSRRILTEGYGCKPPQIPEVTLRKWFDLSETRMAENIKRWGGVPRSISYRSLKDLTVPQKWS